MGVSLDSAKALLSSITKQVQTANSVVGSSTQPPQTQPLTQPASTLVAPPQKVSTKYIPLDNLLGEGVPRGHVLEISAPPGSPKEALILKVVAAFVELGLEVVFLETQNMISPAMIHKALRQSAAPTRLVRFLRVHSLPDFMIFVNRLSSFLEANPLTSLLVVNSISYLFQSDPSMTVSAKNMLLEKVKQAFTKACAQRQLTQIATTSQLATKMLKADGSPGTFDDGAKAVMQPPLGNLYLPSGKSHRVIVIPKGRASGYSANSCFQNSMM
jgi:RAD51-like protein 2